MIDYFIQPVKIGGFFVEVKQLINKDSFLKALSNSKAVRAQDMKLLVAWSALPNRTVTAEQVMEITGAKRAAMIVNNLSKRIAGLLEIELEAGNASSVIALEGSVGESAAWIMHDELAAALSNEISSEPAEAPVEVEIVVTQTDVAARTTAEYEEAKDGSLKAALIEFDQRVVRVAFPKTPVENRLLNPEMINTLITKLPANRRIYQRVIDSSLRTKVNSQESRMFLNQVLDILKRDV